MGGGGGGGESDTMRMTMNFFSLYFSALLIWMTCLSCCVPIRF